jgi:lysophospholipase L1-like esterase
MWIAGAVAAFCITTGTADAAGSAGAAAAPAAAAHSQSSPQWGWGGGQRGDYDYYLALGDSLAWGYQPNPTTGAGVESGHGYADDLAAYLRHEGDHDLKYVNLSCPGETTGTMLEGSCPDLAGSGQKYQVQVDAAAAFLKAHPHARILVTLDIGANNVDGCLSGGSLNTTCVAEGVANAGLQLPQILLKLKEAAGSQVSFVGMNYYDPFLAEWLTGSAGQTLAKESVALSTAFNGVLGAAYTVFGMPVADVSTAFKTTDFTDTVPLDGTTVPVNVADICGWTWMCAPAPVGPNIHANNTGYSVLAKAFEAKLPTRHQHW